jgi:hypothetical protein
MSGMIEGWERHRFETVVGVVAGERRMDVAPLHDLGQATIFDHAGPARHRKVADERAIEFEANEAVVRTRREAFAE